MFPRRQEWLVLTNPIFLPMINILFPKFGKTVELNLLVSFLLLFCISISEGARANINSPLQVTGFGDSIIIKRCVNNKNPNARIYPSITNEKLFFAVADKNGKSYQLFLFDMDSKLVKQTPVMKTQRKLQISVEKGNYLFEVFSDDERIENGSIVIK